MECLGFFLGGLFASNYGRCVQRHLRLRMENLEAMQRSSGQLLEFCPGTAGRVRKGQERLSVPRKTGQ